MRHTVCAVTAHKALCPNTRTWPLTALPTVLLGTVSLKHTYMLHMLKLLLFSLFMLLTV